MTTHADAGRRGGVIEILDTVNRRIGRAAAWLAIAMAAVCFSIVALRYGLSLGWVALQELLGALNAAMFMLALAWVLGDDGHVRVDVFYQRLGPRGRARVDAAGAVVLLMPLCVFLFVSSLDYVAASWRVLEDSREPGGLPGVFLVKTLIPLAAAMLLAQGVVQFARAIARLREARP